MKQPRLVCTIIGAKEGGSAWTPDLAVQAEAAGAAAAEEGFVVLTGGHSGVMAYAAKGASAAGGFTVGILRTEKRTDANPYLDLVLPTGLGVGRNLLTALAAHVVIALRGSMGTLQELAFAVDFERPVLAWGWWQQFPADIVYLPSDASVASVRAWLRHQREMYGSGTNQTLR